MILEQNDLIRMRIIQDMSEGVMILGLDGTIKYMNPAAADILEIRAEDCVGSKFARIFLTDHEKESFCQTILDAIYHPDTNHRQLVPCGTGSRTRQLHVMTSLLSQDGQKLGLIVVIGDITELAELKICYAEQMTTLLDSTVRALSTAIDQRSRYNARHTRNMVMMGEAFLNWLDDTGNPWQFPPERRRAFLMSVWLHDVGKLAVPLTVMDKATRLGPRLSEIEERFVKLRLLDRIAALEGRIDEAERQRRLDEQSAQLELIRQVNNAGFLPDEKLEAVRRLAKARYIDENGAEQPLLNEAEIAALSIRRGTLTDEERALMQSHAAVTETILDSIDFPESFAMVPTWASAHHELLSGRGYPRHLSGDAIPREVRLLTILDIFEALTAKDRPYKGPVPLEKALGILRDMVKEGSLDGQVLSLFEQSRAWEAIL